MYDYIQLLLTWSILLTKINQYNIKVACARLMVSDEQESHLYIH